jgi:hypothetical protein
MARFSPKLTAILITRGVARAVLPLYVMWSIWDWATVGVWHAVIFGVLTVNYVWVYAVSWVAPQLMFGPWRVRPWQTFVLLGNIIVLPIFYYRAHGRHEWFFYFWAAALIAALYVSTALQTYLQRSLPMARIFAARKIARAASSAANTSA